MRLGRTSHYCGRRKSKTRKSVNAFNVSNFFRYKVDIPTEQIEGWTEESLATEWITPWKNSRPINPFLMSDTSLEVSDPPLVHRHIFKRKWFVECLGYYRTSYCTFSDNDGLTIKTKAIRNQPWRHYKTRQCSWGCPIQAHVTLDALGKGLLSEGIWTLNI